MYKREDGPVSGQDPNNVMASNESRSQPAEPSWYARHSMLTATGLGLLAGAAVAGLDLGLGSPGRDWRGSMVLPAGLLTVSVLLTLARVRRDPRVRADRFGLVLAALIGVAFVVVGVSVIPGSTTVPRVLNGGLVVLLGLVLAVTAGWAALRPPVAAGPGREEVDRPGPSTPVDPRRDGRITYPSLPSDRRGRQQPPPGSPTPGG